MADFSLVNIGGGGMFEPIKFPDIYLRRENANRLYINTGGDRMEGVLNMNENKIINLKSPESGHDAANKDYIDKHLGFIKSVLNKQVIEKVTRNSRHIKEQFDKAYKHSTDLKHYLTDTLKTVNKTLQAIRKKVSDNETLTTENSRKLSLLGRRVLLNAYMAPKITLFETKLTSIKNVNHLVLQSKEEIAIIQILIETDGQAWFDIYTLTPSYRFRVFTFNNKIFISCKDQLPDSWSKKVKIYSSKIRKNEPTI